MLYKGVPLLVASGLNANNTCTDFRAWTPEQVGQWLESTVGLGQYQKKFVENDITGETYLPLSRSLTQSSKPHFCGGARA